MPKTALILCSLVALPGLALAAPDPMSAGSSLRKVVIEAGSGDVTVTLEKTQHVKLDAKERGATRDGGTLTVKRAAEAVVITVPERVALDIDAGAGDVRVKGAVGSISVRAGSGDVFLEVSPSEAAEVRAKSASGDVHVTLQNGTPVHIRAQALSGDVKGLDLSKPDAKAKLRLKSTSGDVIVRRAE